MLYETGNTFGNEDGTQWTGGAGAVWDLTSNALRPEKWTSADAAGLPIFPLLIRYDEVEHALATGGEIPHAIRFTVVNSQKAYIWPARHYASSSTNPDYPPMGLRFRLKADFDISGFTTRVQVILRTMKKYGIIVSDNGSNWFIQGTHDDRWDDEEIGALKSISGNNFEAVDISPWLNHPDFNANSGAVPEGSLLSTAIPGSIDNFKIYPNYPNPCHSSTIIRYTLNSPDQILLKVFDINGKEIITLVNEYQLTGDYYVKFKVENLPPGIYFYSLQAGDHGRNIEKMVISYL
jgi:hypothetical protein